MAPFGAGILLDAGVRCKNRRGRARSGTTKGGAAQRALVLGGHHLVHCRDLPERSGPLGSVLMAGCAHGPAGSRGPRSDGTRPSRGTGARAGAPCPRRARPPPGRRPPTPRHSPTRRHLSRDFARTHARRSHGRGTGVLAPRRLASPQSLSCAIQHVYSLVPQRRRRCCFSIPKYGRPKKCPERRTPGFGLLPG